MSQPLVILADQRLELRDKIDELADLGWITPVWTLRAWVYGFGRTYPSIPGIGLDIDKLNLHLDLLQTFITASLPHIREWGRQPLLNALEWALSGLKKSLTPNEQQFLAIYDEGVRHVGSFRETAPPADAAVLLGLADTCFIVLVELERLSYPPLP